MSAARALAALLLLASGAAPARAADSGKLVEADTTMQNVVVRPGDTLWSIAHAYLKDPARWDEILKHNRLPTSDPTVALPGMTLRVPVTLIKVSLRAAHVVYVVNQVRYRHKDSADWKGASVSMEVYQGDTLRTLEDSRARVKFLNKDLLALEPNSMAVIKPAVEDADVELKAGSIFTHARVVTANARVTPRTKDTRYAASIEPDLSTKVEVYKGRAAVDAQGGRVEVAAGMQTRVAPGLQPEAPVPLEDVPDLESRAQEFLSAETVGGGPAPNPRVAPPAPEPEADAESLRSDISVLRVGQPISGFHVQAARDEFFKDVAYDRRFGVDDRFSAADTGLKPGAYWWRVSAVDLLGTEGRYHEPHYYTVGIRRPDTDAEDLSRELTLSSPEENAEVGDSVRVSGILRDDRLTLTVNGSPVRIDGDGNFAIMLKTAVGGNSVVVELTDPKGNTARISRHVTRL